MSSSTLAERNFDLPSAALARAVPGLRRRYATATRARPSARASQRKQGIAQDERWDAHAIARSLADFALPLRKDAEDRWRVLLMAAGLSMLAVLGLIIAHLPLLMRLTREHLRSGSVVILADAISSHLGYVVLFATVASLVIYAEGLFGSSRELSNRECFLVSGKAAFWTTVLIALGLHLSGAKTDVAVQGTVGFVSVVAFWISAAIRRTAGGCAASELSKNVLVVGTTRTARHIAEHLARAENGTRVVKGFIAGAQSGDPLVLGTVDDLPRIARAHFVDEVIVATGQDWQLCERAVAHALHQQLDVTVVPEICAKWPSRVSVKTAGTLPLITLHEEALPRLGLRFKRIFDIIASSTLLVCTAPLLLLIAILIKLESPGPVLYSASRLGRKGRKFTCYKFRSMYVDAERLKDALRDRNQREGPTFKISDDPRITPLGKVLRRYSLDELPQLWNVFNGSMSMVGPRPHPLDDCERYRLEDLRRLDVAPGITGLWQIKARQNPSFATNIALDLEYIENWNLGLDIGILLRTVSAVMRGTGA